MNKMIFISLPVSNLDASKRFYTALGFKLEPRFSDDSGACMEWSDVIKVMLLTHTKWRTFTTRPIPPSDSSEVAFNVSCESREMVDDMIHAAAANGGAIDVNPIQDMGFMYGRLADPDGHVWGPMWMDPAALAASPS